MINEEKHDRIQQNLLEVRGRLWDLRKLDEAGELDDAQLDEFDELYERGKYLESLVAEYQSERRTRKERREQQREDKRARRDKARELDVRIGKPRPGTQPAAPAPDPEPEPPRVENLDIPSGEPQLREGRDGQ